MEELVGHKSSLLILILAGYVCLRLFPYGKRKLDKYAFLITALASFFLLAAYFLGDFIPLINAIGVVALLVIGLWIYLILPGPEFKLSIPEDKKKILKIELISVSILTFVVIGTWQRLAP
ncbi:MAG: hypothetical protein P8Y24_13060 [Gammaproteobacteria bacterium]